tara:strand:- start:168 stop:740 length:573 start_codon:yes stop_codon:yes gene_type:complete
MAKKLESEETELKRRSRQRLIGAIALMLLVIVFLPMFLDNEPQPLSEDILIEIPEIPKNINRPLKKKSLENLPDRSKLLHSREVNTKKQPNKTNVGKDITASSRSDKQYIVQLGAFDDKEAVSKLVKKVKGAKLPVYTEELDINGKVRTRVRVGPYSSKILAQSVVKAIKKIGLKIGEPTVLLVPFNDAK